MYRSEEAIKNFLEKLKVPPERIPLVFSRFSEWAKSRGRWREGGWILIDEEAYRKLDWFAFPPMDVVAYEEVEHLDCPPQADPPPSE